MGRDNENDTKRYTVGEFFLSLNIGSVWVWSSASIGKIFAGRHLPGLHSTQLFFPIALEEQHSANKSYQLNLCSYSIG